MRIALITAQSPCATDGTGAQPDQPTALARALAGHGHRVTVYTRQQSADRPHSTILGRGVSVEHVAAGPARVLPAEQAARHMPELAHYLADRWRVKRPDVVHAFSWTGALAALGAVRGTAVPVVATFGSLGWLERRHTPDGEVSAARLKMEACLCRAVDAVLATSADEAAELARLAVPKPAIRVVPCGVDTRVFSPEGDRAERGRRFRLAAFAPAGTPRGLPAVVRAMAQLPDTELVIIGGPNARHLPRTGPWRELCQLAAALRVRSRLTLAGDVPQGQLAALLRSADLMVSASRYEPTGIGAIQAMACGTPAVVSAVGAHNDAVIDGITGLLVAPEHPAMLAHRVRGLLARPVQLQALGIAAADRAQSRYAADRIGRETAAAYEWCVRGRTSAEPEADEEPADGEDYPAEAGLRTLAAFG